MKEGLTSKKFYDYVAVTNSLDSHAISYWTTKVYVYKKLSTSTLKVVHEIEVERIVILLLRFIK